MSIHVLVIEPDPEEVLLLQEVLTELDGGPYWSRWTHLEFAFATNWSQAEALLERRDAVTPIDIALAELDLPDSTPARTFSRFQTIAPEIPIVLLTSKAELPTAERRLQEGAQDVLLKSELDCFPVAAAIRRALHRHRLLTATRALNSRDQNTGLLTRAAFLAALERDREFLIQKDGRILLVLVEPYQAVSFEAADEGGDPTALAGPDLVEAVEALRKSAGPLDLIGRVGKTQLGLALIEKEMGDLPSRREALIQVARSARLAVGTATFDAAGPVSIDGLLKLAQADLGRQTRAVATVR